MHKHDAFRKKKQYFNFLYLWLIFFGTSTITQTLVDQSMLMRLKKNYDDGAYHRALSLNALIDELKSKPVKEKLVEINRFFNRFPYKSDIELWKKSDYWATPEEFIGVHSGDCEDYVIAKYFALRELGVDEKKLYLTYVRAKNINMAHMVLTYFEEPKSIPLVLDNYELRVLPANERKDLLPVYSFNAKSLFITNASAGLGKKLPTDKIKNSKWTQLLNSIEKKKKK